MTHIYEMDKSFKTNRNNIYLLLLMFEFSFVQFLSYSGEKVFEDFKSDKKKTVM